VQGKKGNLRMTLNPTKPPKTTKASAMTKSKAKSPKALSVKNKRLSELDLCELGKARLKNYHLGTLPQDVGVLRKICVESLELVGEAYALELLELCAEKLEGVLSSNLPPESGVWSQIVTQLRLTNEALASLRPAQDYLAKVRASANAKADKGR
jgi:hypothetical protein